MSKNSSNKQHSNNDLDFVSPFVEVFTEIFEQLVIVLGLLGAAAFKKISKYIRYRYFGEFASAPIKARQLHSKKKTNELGALGISLNNKRIFKLDELNTTKHTAIIGSTGSGKTVCMRLLIEHALNKGMPIIYFDPKANLENIETFKKICAANNKKLHIFSDITNKGTPFNPLLGGTLNDISDKIINSLEWSEPFYKNESIQALDEVLEALDEQSEAITLEGIVNELKKHRNFKNIKGLYNQLKKVSSSEYSHLINQKGPDVLSFNKLRMEDACIYIGISSMGHSSTGHILNKIFFGGLLTHAKDSLIGKVEGLIDLEKKPISIIFDELSSTVHEGFIDLQNKCRQAGMEITYATQGPADIDRVSPTLTAQIFENTNNMFIFNQIVPDHTEFFAKMFGTTKTEKKTHVTDNNQRQSMGSVREVEEFIVHGNTLRNLKVGQCVLLQRIPKRIDLLNIRYWKLNIIQEGGKTNIEEAKNIF
jgi:type IV secretory pathway VirB4 component